jgi:hypothetical protein
MVRLSFPLAFGPALHCSRGRGFCLDGGGQSYAVANVLGGVVLALLIIDLTRTLWPVFVLLGLAVLFFVLPRFLPPEK